MAKPMPQRPSSNRGDQNQSDWTGGRWRAGQGYHTEVQDGEEDETAGAEKRRKGKRMKGGEGK
ncbi:hypothetical protein AJ78_07785 [Emergomyces pasteurianus Ep9510]|uniref:Uncharacterized protein n=1 Tax=Emergomyces pasteurianus Ep9510 TaxID=1447872 RepID=A0A1J9P5M5_9EURO|nr:hypothetical protein AJ78_07785 [Emergomyces pasteurianus Ep9510]